MEQEFLPLIIYLLEAEISIVWQRDKIWDKRRHREVTSSSLVQKSLKDLSEKE